MPDVPLTRSASRSEHHHGDIDAAGYDRVHRDPHPRAARSAEQGQRRDHLVVGRSALDLLEQSCHRGGFLLAAAEFDYGYPSTTPSPPPPPANAAPTAQASATPKSVKVGNSVTLSAKGSTDLETAARDLDYSWDFGDDDQTKDAAGSVVRTRYDEPGTYLATVTVTDSRGLTDTAQVEIVVGGGGPLRPPRLPASENKARFTTERGAHQLGTAQSFAAGSTLKPFTTAFTRGSTTEGSELNAVYAAIV